MSEARSTPAVTMADVLKTARQIAERPSRRALTGVSAAAIAAMAKTVVCLDDVAALALDLCTATDPDEQARIRIDIGRALAALGYLTLVEQEA